MDVKNPPPNLAWSLAARRMCLAQSGTSADSTVGHLQVPWGVRPSGTQHVEMVPGFFGLLIRVTPELRCDNFGELVSRHTP